MHTEALDKIEDLEQTLFELRGDIASGTHVPPNVRVLSMRENPLQEWTDLRQEVMDRLKGENGALLKRLEELEAAGAGAGQVAGEHLVPRESWEKEHKEKCELEETVKQKEKRLLRLQQARVFLPFRLTHTDRHVCLRRCSAVRHKSSARPCLRSSGSRSTFSRTDRSR
jgi:hypothetical protein